MPDVPITYGDPGEKYRKPFSKEEIHQLLNPAPKTFRTKCPRCGFQMLSPRVDEVIECPKCGAHLARKNNEDDKLITEPDEIVHTEFDAEEKWREDHPDS